MFYFVYFSDFCQSNYLNIYRTDLHEICRIGRTLGANECSQVIFFDPSKGVAVATNVVGKIDYQSTRMTFVRAVPPPPSIFGRRHTTRKAIAMQGEGKQIT